jgi:AcrR family transcriptional regulator
MTAAKPTTKKEQSRERILAAATRAIRRHGYEGVGVAEVMKEAGLTHGGFYAHFESRDALLAHAADQAGLEAVELLEGAVAGAKPEERLMAIVDAYLADGHLEALESGLGCALASAGSDVPRQSEKVRRAVGHRVKEMIALAERQLPHRGKHVAQEKAMAVVASLVGAVVLARAVGDTRLSKGIRRAMREFIRAGAG